MKERYEKPSSELEIFESQDVLTTSSGESNPPWGGDEVPPIWC